jgi:hypothetical protein
MALVLLEGVLGRDGLGRPIRRDRTVVDAASELVSVALSAQMLPRQMLIRLWPRRPSSIWLVQVRSCFDWMRREAVSQGVIRAGHLGVLSDFIEVPTACSVLHPWVNILS